MVDKDTQAAEGEGEVKAPDDDKQAQGAVIDAPEKERNKAKAQFKKEMDEAIEAGKSEEEKEADKNRQADKNVNEEKQNDDAKSQEDTPADDKGAKKPEDERKAIPRTLIDRAVRAGMTSEDAENCSSADMLTRIVDGLEQAAKIADKQTPDAQGSEEGKAAEEGQKSPLDDVDISKFDDDTQAVLGPIVEVAKGMQGQLNDLAAENVALRDKLSGMERDSQLGSFDQKVADLGDDFTELLGTGKTTDLAEGSTEAANRAKLERFIGIMHDEAKASGTSLSATEAFDKALLSAFPEQATDIKATAKAKELAKKSVDRSKKASAQPRQSDGSFAKDKVGEAKLTDEQLYDKAVGTAQEILDAAKAM